jgi:hypothetical protein
MESNEHPYKLQPSAFVVFSESLSLNDVVACTGNLTPFQADVRTGMNEFRQCTPEDQMCEVA